ncbi:spore germination protein [Bacillus sp. OK048]|uniref:spore germination protein n=1 Tax=Bacillus sp. OK048 TaxID=1882761 RepID=UPI000887BEB3|nr:spore germination protein [Bacillus sp. OK048]SDN58294.1 spore germination protein PA/spore germination protein PF [Bacillus sp. OK048]
MTNIPGHLKIDTVSGGLINFGNSVFISPKSSAKAFAGSGSDNTGIQINTFTGQSSTTTLDSDVVDQPIVKE